MIIFFIGFIFLLGKNAYAESNTTYTTWLLAISINNINKNKIGLFLQDKQNKFYANIDDLRTFGLSLQTRDVIRFQNKNYINLDTVPGLSYQIDKQKLTLNILISSSSLSPQNLSANNFTPVQVPRPSPGGYFNYDLSAQQTFGETSQVGGLFTASYFNQEGVGTYNFLAENNDGQNEFVRLNTTWQVDYPEKMRTLRIGDAYTSSSIWSQSIGFGGIQWGTNFNTQPSFVNFPLPSISGVAALPSSVNLMVNNTLSSTQQVDSGPFSINSIPVVSGAGEVSVVTTDLLGRQQIVSVPYYATPLLLKPGLQDFSYEAGFLRNNYGSVSNDYGPAVISATDAIGITNHLTEQWHAEFLLNQQTTGWGSNYLISTLGVLNGAVALSNSQEGGLGALASLGFQRQAAQGMSFGTNLQLSSPAFIELGYDAFTYPSFQSQSYIGFPFSSGSNLSLAYTIQNNRDSDSASLLSASYNKTFNHIWTVNLTLLTNVGGELKNQAVLITLSKALGSDTSMNIGGTAEKDNNQGSVQITRNLPEGTGYGYNLLAAAGNSNNYQASFSAQNNIGTYTVGVAGQNNESGVKAEASGALVWLNQQPFMSREITNSFAVVETDVPNINIYNYNQIVATTNQKGEALLPNLIPYQTNPIAINPIELPLNVEINQTSVNITPYYNSGQIVRLNLQVEKQAIVTVVQSSGEVVPAGALVTNQKTHTTFPVGNHGMLFLDHLDNVNNFIATWGNDQCFFKLVYPGEDKSPLPNLGTIVCHPEIKVNQ